MPALAPSSSPATLAKLDGRTKEARLVRQVRRDLLAQVGGNPTAVQRALIERAVQLHLQVANMDRRTAEGRAMTDLDSRTYLAWSNSLVRTLRELARTASATQPKPPSIADYLATRA